MGKDKNFIFMIVVFVLVGAVSWHLYFKKYLQQDTVNIHDFPREIGGWTARELKITEEEYAILETRNVFTRRYTRSDGASVDLMIVYSQNNRKVSHPPEICYTGNGATILSNERVSLPADNVSGEIFANRLVLDFGQSTQLSYYWFKVGGDAYTTNYWKQQLLIALKTLTGQAASSALIRISAPVQNEDQKMTEEEVKSFNKDMFPLLAQYLP